MAKQRKPEAPAVRAPLSESKKRLLFLYLVRNPAVWEPAARVLTSEHFHRPRDDHYLLVWEALVRHYRESNRPPDALQLGAEVGQLLEETPNALDDEQDKKLEEYLAFWFEPHEPDPAGPEVVDQALPLLRRFVEEAALRALRRDYEDLDLMPQDPLAAVSRHTATLEEAARLTQTAAGGLFSGDWENDVLAPPVTPTGVDFVDYMIGGGDYPGTVNSLTGPLGGGKSTLMLQIAVNRALDEIDRKRQDESYQIRPVYFATYEMTKPEFKLRSLVYAARIHKDHFRACHSVAGLRRKFGQEYELAEFASSHLELGLKVASEYERAKYYARLLETSLHLLTFDGSDPDGMSGKGDGGIREVAQLIETDQRRRGYPGSSGIYTDYVNAMVDRMITSGSDIDRKRHEEIDRVPLLARNLMAVKYQAPVWLVQQSKGTMLDKQPGARLTVADSQGSKTFSMNCYYSLQLGNLDKQLNMTRFALTKARDTQQIQQDLVVRLDGKFARWVDTKGRYMIRNGRIIETRAAQAVQSGQSLLEQKQRNGYAPPGEAYMSEDS